MSSKPSNVHMIKAFDDNYIFALSFAKQALVIDPGQCRPVMDFLKKQDFSLSFILCTHHHSDHTGGMEELKELFDCKAFGPSEVSGLDTYLEDEESFQTGPFLWKAIKTPGHTLGHLCYYLEQEKLLFSGDTLFSAGCGRLFEAGAEVMFSSLQKLYQLEDEVLLYCAHEYTLQNLKFSLSLDPENEALKKAISDAKKALSEKKSTLPSTLAKERKLNPFFQLCHHKTAENIEEFARRRHLKDVF